MIRRIFIIICTLIIFLPVLDVDGDIAPDPNYLTSITAMNQDIQSFLNEVNVTMYVNEKVADGQGSFKISNPSNEWENFSVVFDPGTYSYDIDVEIEGKRPFFESVRYDNFYGEYWRVYGIKFNVSVPPEGDTISNITWKYHVDQDSHKQLYYHTDRLVEYLVIGTMGWSEPISKVDVRFVITTDEYK